MLTPANFSFRWFDGLLADTRYAFRMAGKHVGFTALVVLTMALGIGAATATFSILDVVLIRPLPYKDGTRLVSVYLTVPSFRSTPALSKIWDHLGPGLSDLEEFRKRQTSFDNVAVIRNVGAFLELDEKRRIQIGTVSTNFFSMLGVKPRYGTLFSSEEEKPNATATAVLSQGIWERVFGGDPLVLGRAITLQRQQGREQYVVIGILPATFEFADYGVDASPSPDVWLSTAGSKSEDGDFNVIATLKPGVSISNAEGEAATLFDKGLGVEGRKLFGSVGARVSPVQKEQAQDIRTSLFILAAAAGLLLFIACGNVANLLLAQGSTRSHEMALRAAVGARRGRIVRQLLTESALLFLSGGAGGILFAHWSVRALLGLSPVPIPRVNEIDVDGRALLFALLVSAITGILFGLVPAFLATRADLNETLKRTANNRGTQHNRTQGLVIVAEISVSFVLLIAAGLLTQTLFRLLSESNHMHAEHLLSVHADLSEVKFKGNADFQAFANDALQRIQSLPDVAGSAITTPAPFAGRTVQAVILEGSRAGEPPQLLDNRAVSKDYFRTLEIPMLTGRQFTDADMAAPDTVAIVNQKMAKQLWSMDTAVNKRFRWAEDPERHWITVVGVCADVLDLEGADGKSLPVFFVPLQQGRDSLTFLIRSGGEPTVLSRSIRQGILDVEKNVAIDRVEALDSLLRTSLAGQRYRAILINLFATTAAFLALIGLYGVISRFVAIRTRELSIRMALGAQSRDVLGFVFRRSLLLTGAGIVIGAAVAAASTRWLSNLLFGVGAFDLATFVAVGLFLLTVALLSTYIPARRASRTDPIIALRAE